jgi:hypothetical protein
MSNIENQMREVEVTIEECESQVEQAEALERLHKNADFKKLILDEYFEKNAIRTVMMKSAAGHAGEKEQKDLDNVLIGIGQLGQYFHKIFTFGEGAARAIDEHKNTMEELRAEDLSASGPQLVN